MDFKQLNTFLTVSTLLNFTKAASQLGYAQSSITAQIQQLESELDIKLFERIGKTVTLTYAGTMLIPYVTQILNLSKNMKDTLSNSAAPTGTLTIGAAESLSIFRLPVILKEYRNLYPNVDINLKLLNCSEFLPNLSNGTIDVAFTIGCKMESEYIIEEIELPEPILVLACPGHPFIQREEVFPKDFENEALLLTGINCCYRGAFVNRLSKNKVIPKIVLETDSIQAIKQAAMSGLGICVLPAISVTEEVATGKLIPLRINTEDFRIVSQLLYHKDKWISPALSSFIKLSNRILKCDRLS